MKIEFFDTKKGFDQRAVGAGVYSISLRYEGKRGGIPLYIGESLWMARRCAEHLYAIFEEPEYLGLTDKDLRENNNLILRFEVKEMVKDVKMILREKEKGWIKELRPLTQREESDGQLRIPEKLERVQKAIERWEKSAD